MRRHFIHNRKECDNVIKKLTASLCAGVLLLSSSVMAQAAVDAVWENNSVVFEKQAWMGSLAVVSFYNEDGVLSASKVCREENGRFILPLNTDEENMRMRGYFGQDSEITDIKISEPVPTVSPAPTSSPSPTSAPGKNFPDIYETESDASKAFAVITGVERASGEEKGDGTYLNILYQGREDRVFISEDVIISSASDAVSDLKGEAAYNLKKGDVVRFGYNISKEIRKLYLIYRPVKEDIVTGTADYGKSFEHLISENGMVAGDISELSACKVGIYGGNTSARTQYVFGLIQDKSGKNIRLFNKDGRDKDAIEVTLESNSVVYVCDMSQKTAPEIGAAGSVVKSGIPKSAYDDNGNVTYSSEYTNNYMLARVINGTVTDAVVYTNYNN